MGRIEFGRIMRQATSGMSRDALWQNVKWNMFSLVTPHSNLYTSFLPPQHCSPPMSMFSLSLLHVQTHACAHTTVFMNHNLRKYQLC